MLCNKLKQNFYEGPWQGIPTNTHTYVRIYTHNLICKDVIKANKDSRKKPNITIHLPSHYKTFVCVCLFSSFSNDTIELIFYETIYISKKHCDYSLFKSLLRVQMKTWWEGEITKNIAYFKALRRKEKQIAYFKALAWK